MDKQYLNKHKIPELINEVILQLVELRPADPKTFLANAILHTCEVDTGYPELTGKANLLSRCLTPALYEKLKAVRTSSGFTLDRAIQVGVDGGAEGEPGVVAGDEDSYTVFAELFTPIMEAYHRPSGGPAIAEKFRSDLNHGKLTGGLLSDLHVVSCRIRTVRNLRGYALLPQCSRRERREVEALVCGACGELPDDLAGTVAPLVRLPEELSRLAAKGLIPHRPDTVEAASACLARDWPDGRSVFVNSGRTFAVWANVKDHAKLISTQSGGQLRQVFERFCDGVSAFEAALMKQGASVMRHPRLGNLATCPGDVGTGVRASLFVKLENLARDERFPEVLKKLGLKSRAPRLPMEKSVLEIFNASKLGSTELELVQLVADGVEKLIKWEKSMEMGYGVSSAIDELLLQ
eukprot:RCo014843